MSDARSTGGCWTCRVRRKKCDEAHPACLTCTSLHLPCDGYGPKPAWMDRGVKEREIAKGLRNTVKQTLSLQRLRQSQQSTSKTPSDTHTPLSPVCPTSTYDISSEDVPDINLLSRESPNWTDPSHTISL